MERLPVEAGADGADHESSRRSAATEATVSRAQRASGRTDDDGSFDRRLIFWLIVAIIAIAIIVYLVNWLYHRSSKEVSFVRTGFLGERVVINGGAFVLPFIHDFTPVNMNALPMRDLREKQTPLITSDRMRIDIEADFYVRVAPTREAVAIAAATLGRRTLEPDG